jgi:hypothetical protein
MKDLEDKYARMLRRMDGEDPELMAWDMLEDESLPFTGRVKAYPMPDKFKMPRIEKYDGNGDPQEHLEAFREHLILHGTPDEIACRAFPLTLKGVAKDWFIGLPPKSVGTFKDLGRLFLTQFLATRKRKKDPTCLLTLCQDKEESLKDFMLRFNREKLEVDTPDDKTLLCALMQGIRAERPLMAEVGRKNVNKVTLPQFMKLTEEFIHQEKLVGAFLKAQTLEEQAKKERKKDSNPPKEKEDKNPRKGEKKRGPLFKSEPRKTEPPRFPKEVFTPLNASLTEVFSAIKGDPAFRWPQKMKAATSTCTEQVESSNIDLSPYDEIPDGGGSRSSVGRSASRKEVFQHFDEKSIRFDRIHSGFGTRCQRGTSRAARGSLDWGRKGLADRNLPR